MATATVTETNTNRNERRISRNNNSSTNSRFHAMQPGGNWQHVTPGQSFSTPNPSILKPDKSDKDSQDGENDKERNLGSKETPENKRGIFGTGDHAMPTSPMSQPFQNTQLTSPHLQIFRPLVSNKVWLHQGQPHLVLQDIIPHQCKEDKKSQRDN